MLSILIPAYNCENSITDTLLSIKSQTYNPDSIEVVIVDDGSKDGTVERIRRFQNENPTMNIKLLEQQNGGPGAARNAAIDAAEGDFIFFVDSDDILFSNYCSLLVSGISDRADFCFGAYEKIVDNKNSLVMRSEVSGESNAEDVFVSFIQHRTHISLWNSIFKADIIKRYNIRFKELFFGEDVDFIARYLMYCEKVIAIDDIVYKFFYDSNRAFSREKNKVINDVSEVLLYDLLPDLEYSGKCKAYMNLKNGYLPLECLTNLMKKAYISSDYKMFISDIKKNSSLVEYVKNLTHKAVKSRMYIKATIMRFMLIFVPRVFFLVAKKKYKRLYL